MRPDLIRLPTIHFIQFPPFYQPPLVLAIGGGDRVRVVRFDQIRHSPRGI